MKIKEKSGMKFKNPHFEIFSPIIITVLERELDDLKSVYDEDIVDFIHG